VRLPIETSGGRGLAVVRSAGGCSGERPVLYLALLAAAIPMLAAFEAWRADGFRL
jgi:hypothetical protein